MINIDDITKDAKEKFDKQVVLLKTVQDASNELRDLGINIAVTVY